MKYYEDLLVRIPRPEVSEIFEIIKAAGQLRLFLSVCSCLQPPKLTPSCMSKLWVHIDVDSLTVEISMLSVFAQRLELVVTRKILTRDTADGLTHKGALVKLCNLLAGRGLMKHTLSAPSDWHALDAKFMGLCSLPGGRVRHIDILCVPGKLFVQQACYPSDSS